MWLIVGLPGGNNKKFLTDNFEVAGSERFHRRTLSGSKVLASALVWERIGET
jgi:hypothetical protein